MDTPVERQGHASVIIMDSLLIFGGSNESGLLSDFWIFNFITQKWTEITPTGEKLVKRTNHKAVTLSGSKINKIELQFLEDLLHSKHQMNKI